MKKNLLAIAILAAVVANIILSCVVLFSIVPAAKNANKLVEKICTIINLDLENPDAADYTKVPVSNRVVSSVGSGLTVNLKKAEGETKSRYALVDFNIVFNNGAADYATASAALETQKAVLNEYLTNIIMGYTADELLENKAQIKKQVLSYCRTYFKTSDTSTDELVVDITLGFTVQ